MLATSSELRSRVEAALERRIPRALTPPQRPAPELMPTGIADVDAITDGIPLGCLTEICGPSSSGRTSVLLAAMAQCMRRGELCALVDASDAFDPQSAANAGLDLERLLWVRCQDAVSPRRHGETRRELGDRVIGSLDHQNRTKRGLAESRKPLADSLSSSPDHPITRFSVSGRTGPQDHRPPSPGRRIWTYCSRPG